MSLNEDSIVELVRGTSSDGSRVVKRSDNCLVVEDSSYFYKIRPRGEDAKRCFEEIVLRAFVQVYQEFGLDWEVSAVSDGSQDFLVERRQKLEVASANNLTFEEVLANGAEIKRKVENRLEFPRLLAQLRLSGNFEHIKKITLARDCEDDFSDYAVYKGQTIFLGTSSWFLALLNEKGSWDSNCNAAAIPVSLSYGDFFFADQRVFDPDEKAVVRLFEVVPTWWLFSAQAVNIVEARAHVAGDLEQMFSSNVELLFTKKAQKLRVDRDFLNMTGECEKLRLGSGEND